MFALFQGLLEKMILNDSLLSIALIALISGTSKSFGFHLRCSHRYSQGYNWFSSRDVVSGNCHTNSLGHLPGRLIRSSFCFYGQNQLCRDNVQH